MPDDRASALLANKDLSRYPALQRLSFLQRLDQSLATQDRSANGRLLPAKQALDLLDEAITEVQHTPTTTISQQQKERLVSNQPIDRQTVDSGPEGQTEQPVETTTTIEQSAVVERAESGREQAEQREISELGQEIKEIGEQQKAPAAPQETINSLAAAASADSPQSTQPVVVLPITEAKFVEGKKQGVNSSLRWLTEWIKKIKQIFSGAVFYQEQVENSSDH